MNVGELPLIVGVTSHRDLRSEEMGRVREQIRRRLTSLCTDFPGLRLTILSPLAEGGDRLVAEEGLRLGARLMVPLPLPLELYMRDFASAESRAEFEGLLAQGVALPLPLPEAVSLDALCIAGQARNMQYARCGLYIADHCHLLLALWDGRATGRMGGTGQVVSYYLGASMPGARDARKRIRQVLANDDDSLVFHLPVGRRQHAEGLAGALASPEEPSWLTSAGSAPGGQEMPAGFQVIFNRLQAFAQDLRKYPDSQPESAYPSLAAYMHRRADRLAMHFQRRMLFALRSTYALAALMAIALMLYPDSLRPQLLLWLFLAMFVAGAVIAWIAHRREWHRKYIDYRALAEGLRIQSFWRRAGISASGDEQFAHDNFLQKRDGDLGWIRNAMRHANLEPLRSFTPEDVETVCDDWVGKDENEGQLGWYALKASQREREHRRTHWIGAITLWLGIAICLLLALFYGSFGEAWQNRLGLAVGVLSIIAAVRTAYTFRKADRELVKQYRFMQRIYANARRSLIACSDWREKQEILRSLGEAALSEHAEWALMHRERPLEHGRI